MKILFLTEFFPVRKDGEISGGSESRTYFLSSELAKRGHDVVVITAYLPGSRRIDSWNGVQVYRVGPRYAYVQSGSNLARISYLFQAILMGRRVSFDVVDANNIATYLGGFILAKLKGRKVVFWVPDIMGVSQWKRALGWWNGFIGFVDELISLILPTDKIIALSDVTRDKLRRRFVPSSRIAVVYPGSKLVSSRKLPDGNMVLAIQRLVEYKRTDLLVEAMAYLPASVRCEIIGEGREAKGLTEMAREMGVESRVEFLGNLPRKKILEKIRGSQIFCLPSEIEGFGIVTLEAMGAGVPFINSNIPVHREILAKSGAGVLFKMGEARDLARKIGDLLHDRGKYSRLSERARDFSGKHTLKTMALETEKVYEGLYFK